MEVAVGGGSTLITGGSGTENSMFMQAHVWMCSCISHVEMPVFRSTCIYSSDLKEEVFRCGYNGYVVHVSILKTSQCLHVSGAITNSHTATVTIIFISVVDDVASCISQWSGWGPGHCDTSGTSLDCCHITGR